MGETPRGEAFDGAAAVTRSLLGYGVVAGAFYLVVGVVLALTRDGFDLSQHPLSLLMLGEHGWMQAANLIVTGLMVLAAAYGFIRAMRGSAGAGRAGTLLGIYGVCFVASGLFPPDPMAGFPPGGAGAEGSLSGVLHFAFGAVAFLCLAAAAFVLGGWHARRGDRRRAMYSRIGGAVVLIGFMAGGALATQTAGVVTLWVAVVAGWVWLALASIDLYKTVPHPDIHRREPVRV